MHHYQQLHLHKQICGDVSVIHKINVMRHSTLVLDLYMYLSLLLYDTVTTDFCQPTKQSFSTVDETHQIICTIIKFLHTNYHTKQYHRHMSRGR